jgi:uncharacterized RDD family membrane protein YckC
MNNRETPLEIEGIEESLYGDFALRLGARILDIIIWSPYSVIVLYLGSIDKYYYICAIILSQILTLWYHIYLPKVYGGTPGKLLIGIKIIKLNGEPIGWREAILRSSVQMTLGLLSNAIWIFCFVKADAPTFKSLGWIKQTQYLVTFSPLLLGLDAWLKNIWKFSELLVFFTNKRKRAIHDYIAGTVVLKADLIDKIRDSMSLTETNINETTVNDFSTQNSII